MADVQSNIHVNIDTSDALASLKLLQRQISAFHTQMSKSGAAASAVAANQAQNLMNSINATGKFQATMRTVATSTEYFTNALEKNKLTSREYFRYTGAATKTFGRLFKSEFETINKVARERVKDIQTQYIKMGRGANGALQAIAVRPLTLDMKNLATQTQIAAQRQQLLNQLLKQGSTNLLNFGKNTQWAGRQLMVGFTVPLMLLGSTAAKTFMKLEEQAIRFKRVYGEMFTTQEETDAMVKQIQTLAKEYTKYGVAVEKTMEMAANAAAMGKMGAELTAQVTEATRLAVLGGVEQEQALETTISVTNAFGVAAEDLAKKIDFLNAVENQTVVSIEDLTIAIPKAGPVVQQLGGDVEDLAFFLTAMKEGGINASEGANALKSGLASLINPSEKASKMLAEMGINIRGIVEANKGDVAATVVGFAQALDTLDPLNRARAIEQLFGKFQFSRLSTLFQNVTAQGSQAARVLGLTRATTEELAILSQRELDKIENTTTYKFKKSIEDLKVTLAPVGEQFLKALTPIVEFASKVLEKFNNLGDGSKRFLTILTVALGAIGPIALMTFGLLANGLANIIKLFATMKSSFNRAGTSTQILGNQTDYLTKQQLEASAVAASLDQVHQKLRQTFTSEAAAVNALAAAYQKAIASQLGFAGPVGKGRIPQSRKYSNGITSIPGPKGAGDIVPILASPGEAVIPAGPAQDPANKPFIAHMVAGGRIPGFKKGTDEIKKDNNVTNKTHVGGKSTPKEIQDIIKNNPYMTQDQRNKLLAMEQIFKSQGLPTTTTTKHGLMFDFPEWMNKAMPSLTTGVPVQEFIDEWERRGPEKWKPSGMNAAQAAALDRAFLDSFKLSTSTYINDRIVDDIFKNEVPKYINPEDRAYQKAQQLYATDSRFNMGKGLGSTPEESRRILQNAKDKGFIKDFDIKEGFGTGEGRTDKVVTKSSTVTLNDGTTVNMNRLGAGTTPVISQKPTSGGAVTAPELIQENMEKARSQEATLKAIADEAAKTKTGQKKPTNFGKQISKTTGRSFDVREVGGIFEKPNGQKVFVKPMMSELNAIAEKEATDFARKVQGLDVPKQKIATMIDPTDPEGKRKIIVLESKYDPKYADLMSKSFTQEQYFRQLVSANLRGDNDLKMGNLGGNALADVGRAGVLSKASGIGALATQMPSLLEMAEENLKGVPGKQAKNSPNWFANATKDIALNLTPDEYDRQMKAEIQRQLNNAEPYVAKMPADHPLKSQYVAMLERLREGLKVDWKTLHQKHSSILVKPDEVSEDEDGKNKKIKSEPNNRKFKSTGGPKDTRLVPASMAPSIRQGPRGVRIVGKADAPLSSQEVKDRINKANSQAKAAASRTALYGDGPIDAEQKSLRRKIQQLQKDGKKLSVVAQNVAVTQKVVTENMTKNIKQGLSATGVKSKMQSTSSKILESFRARQAAKANPDDPNNPKSRGGMGVGGAAMAVAGIAMVGSMIPGSVGEMFQKLMMPLMGLSMILPMVNNKFGALAVGLAATVGSMVALRMAFDKAANKVLEENEKFRGSTSAIDSIAKFGGKVTASEQMDLRRKNSFSMLGPATGKTTYGEAFVQTKEGKALTENLSKQSAAGKGSQAASDLSNQLSTAVMSGAMDINQAKSLAMNAARQAGDITIGLKVIAQMEKVLGPNGEDLDKNPLQVRMRMINENQKRMQSNISNIQNASPITKLAGQKTMQIAGIGASALGGAAAGAGIGSFIGGPIGAAVGAGIGAAAGAAFGYLQSKKYAKQAGELGAAYAVDSKIALEQNKQMLDSLDMYYQKKIEELRLQGKINEALELEKEYLGDKEKGTVGKRNELTAAQAKIQSDMVSQYNSAGGMQEAMMGGMKKAAKARYKDNPNEVAYMDVVGTQAANLRKSGAIDSGQEFLIQAKMASGDIPPSVFRQLLQMATDNKDIAPKMMNIITKFSGATSETIGVAAQNILTADNKIDKEVQTKFITKVEAFEKDSDALDFAKNMVKLNNLNAVIPSNVLVKYYTENDAAYQQLNKMLDAIEGKKDLTATMVYEIIPEVKGTNAFNEEYFNTLTEDQQKVYTTTIAAVINVPDPQIVASDDYQNWLKENTVIGGRTYGGAQYKGLSQAAMIAHYKEQQGFKAVTENVSIGANAPVSGDKSGSGNKPKSSPLDDLLKKLRDVRKNQIKVTEGFDASFKSLNKLFGGKKTIEVFSGIENDMRRLGAGEDLIELIVGMDPKEFEKQKNKLFKFKNGEIVALKDGAKSIGDALQSIALGDFVSTQDRMVKNIGNQNAALARLKAAGVDGSVALEMVADASTAAAIANNKLSDKQLKKVIKAANEATKAQRRMAAVQSIEQENKDIQQRSDLYEKLISNLGRFNQAEIEAIINNQGLTEGLLTGAANFAEGLALAVKKKRIELNLKLMTIEGMQEIFDTGVSNAMEAFDVEETKLRLSFDVQNKPLKEEIRKAEELIAKTQEKIRIQEVSLKEIETQEEKVNEKYDERLKALDEIEKANSYIAQQQKGQLTLAEALTSGDIAAAARAAQDMRAQSAADALTRQRDALGLAREYELSELRSKDGRTRIQIEKEIKDLQDQIYEIETKSLEPNRETLRLNELALEKSIESITVLEKTRAEWEQIKNAVDLARVASAQFVKSMQDALNVQGRLINAYNNQQVNTDPVVPAQTVVCPPGYKQVGNNCVMDGKTEVVCPAGFKQVGDKCVKEGTTEIICPEGHKLVGNNCVKEGATKTVCPEGYNLVGNDCVKQGTIKEEIVPATDTNTKTNTNTGTTKYVVQPGDTLSEIAADNNISLKQLLALNPKFTDDPKYKNGNMIWSGTTVKLPTGSGAAAGSGGGGGGFMQALAKGGLINPMRFAMGGFARGTDTVPAMLTPGEFIMSKYAVDSYGLDTMKQINKGEAVGGSVYNNTYTLTVNAKTDANPNEIAQAVMATIKQVDDRRIRGVAISGRR